MFRPRHLHLIRFHGVLAPNAKLRREIIPTPAEPATEPSSDHAHARRRGVSSIPNGLRAETGCQRKPTMALGLSLSECSNKDQISRCRPLIARTS